MKKVVSLIVALSVGPCLATAEIIQTTDGRNIELRSDGTFEVLSTEVDPVVGYVEVLEPYFRHHEGQYGQNRVRFMPIFKNASDVTITGAKFSAVFQNAFGDEVFKFNGDSAEKIRPGKASTNDLFYYFEDNQFIAGEPYDKLLPLVTAGTAKIVVAIDALVFEDGSVKKFGK